MELRLNLNLSLSLSLPFSTSRSRSSSQAYLSTPLSLFALPFCLSLSFLHPFSPFSKKNFHHSHKTQKTWKSNQNKPTPSIDRPQKPQQAFLQPSYDNLGHFHGTVDSNAYGPNPLLLSGSPAECLHWISVSALCVMQNGRWFGPAVLSWFSSLGFVLRSLSFFCLFLLLFFSVRVCVRFARSLKWDESEIFFFLFRLFLWMWDFVDIYLSPRGGRRTRLSSEDK